MLDIAFWFADNKVIGLLGNRYIGWQTYYIINVPKRDISQERGQKQEDPLKTKLQIRVKT